MKNKKYFSGNLVIIFNKKDNVATALKAIKKNTCLKLLADNKLLRVKADIEPGFKISLGRIPKNTKIFKYGQVIGLAKKEIKAGERIHIENLASLIK